MTTDNILGICSNIMNVDLKEKKRLRHLVFCRAVYYRICYDNGYQLTQMARSCGFDHATAIHGLKVFINDIETESSKHHKVYYGLYRNCSAAITATSHLEEQYVDRLEILEKRMEGLEEEVRVFLKYLKPEESF